MNGVYIFTGDIWNACLQAPISEKHYVICGHEFGLEHEGKKALVVRAIYGGQVAGHEFWLPLGSCMNFLGFQSWLADPYVWMRAVKRADGTEYTTHMS